ncbi:MAG: TatD family hydrolase [Methanomicrobiales archaeon]|nr:TatD family hydrolase [Methanomicrobiales archaeon]
MNRAPRYPITDDHIHLDPVNGIGIEAAKEFQRAGGTHLFVVTKPSWSHGIVPSRGGDYRPVFEATISMAREVTGLGLGAFAVLGVHPAEISRLADQMPLSRAAEVMREGLSLAAEYVRRGEAVALKSGRPHYPVEPPVWEASRSVLRHALALGAECGCAVQIHAESGPCTDVVEMAREEGMPPDRVVKHFATPDTPLVPSLIARHEAIPALCREGRAFTMESDYMDERSRPGAVIGPKSVPRFTLRLVGAGAITEEDLWRIHAETPSRVYGVEIRLP